MSIEPHGPHLSSASQAVTQAGSAARFVRRWRLIGAGLSNVWRFGDLELPAASGRLLLRGPNGTGKTTALEALWPYLLDLNAARLAAGKARPTSLSSLMREGAAGKRRYGYVWLTLSGPGEGTWSFGVRLQYSEGASPPVKVIPFVVPGRPLHELRLHAAGRTALTVEQFAEAIATQAGQIFANEEGYLSHLAARIFGTPDREELAMLAGRLRQVRNPTLLGDVSPQGAADALRESLPGVAEDVIAATAEALAESDSTREAFARDKVAAELLEDFRAVWSAHATEVVSNAHAAAGAAADEVRERRQEVKTCSDKLAAAGRAAANAKEWVGELESVLVIAKGEIKALEDHQTYKDAGRLKELKTAFAAQTRAANATAQVMQETARGAAGDGESLRRDLDNIIEDLAECVSQASSAEPAAAPGEPLLSWSDRPRGVLRAGDVAADPGPELAIYGDSQRLRTTASSLLERAQVHALQADAASLALIDYKPVDLLQKAATEATKVAGDAAAKADGETAKAKGAESAARDAAKGLLGAVSSWTRSHPRFAESSQTAPDRESPGSGVSREGWTSEDVDQLATAEPGQVLAACDVWARHALSRAEGIAAELRARGQHASSEAVKLRGEAGRLREEAKELRAGRLLPLPRPEWAGPADDSIALGAALDWPAHFGDTRSRALLEVALGAAGLLGASLGNSGASTQLWRVDATGLMVSPNLGELIAVDPEHPLAAVASAVLERVRLAPTSIVEASAESDSALIIGRDGTFRAGVLSGQVPGAVDPAQLPAARHVGARQRREAALARADELDRQAEGLEAQAEEQEDVAEQLANEADRISALGHGFPSTEELRDAESHRSAVSRTAREAREVADAASLEAELLVHEAQQARTEWLERTRARSLPGDIEQLVRLRDHGTATAELLRRAAGPLGGKLAERLDRIIERYSTSDCAQKLVQVETEARAAFRTAKETETVLQVLEETAGAAIAEVLARHESACARLASLEGNLGPARKTQLEAVDKEATARGQLENAEGHLRDAQPKAAALLRALRALLGVSGVAEAVTDGDLPADDAQLLSQIELKLQGRKTITKKTVRERADAARAKLAGIWSLDPGEDSGELLTYMLTHRDAAYTPTQAAVHATLLSRRAEQALAASEERALREFVLGRLPSAISTAWIRLHDWVTEVNRKMRSASASSGVGVQVRIPQREDLAPASRAVLELSCRVSDAERTPDQQKQLGESLHALLAAAEGDTMQQRVASAVDVRSWVEVHYEVTRPGGKTQRWNSKTGLSGGERRLVVLAPMLAALAAAYDRFGEKTLRLVPLDEVPAEVDERGREGLARYIAELDLDLVCSSYLWDGCPGAWDGIDAHDMEAGPDGTVVAFPMLVRGLIPVPEEVGPSGVTASGMGDEERG
jgi:hypothetical protein